MLVSRLSYYFSSIPTLLTGIKNWASVATSLFRRSDHPFIVELREGARFFVRTALDIWVLKEAFLDREYERASTEIQDGWTIVDVGAGLGDFAIGVARAHPRCRIYAFEPFANSYSLLRRNLEMNRVQNVHAFPTAIAGRAGAIKLRGISSEPVEITILDGNRWGQAAADQVQTTTLQQVFAELQVFTCDFLKMDCQGAEYEILFSCDDATLSRVRHLCLEYHDCVGDRSHHDLKEFLVQHGFEVRLLPNRVHWGLGLLYARQTGNDGFRGN